MRALDANVDVSVTAEGDFASTIQAGKLLANLDTRVVSVDGKRVHLTGKEYGILELLSLRKGSTVTKEMFLNHLYAGMDEPEIKIIDVFVCKLRKKLDRVGPRLCVARPDSNIGRDQRSGPRRSWCEGGVRAARGYACRSNPQPLSQFEERLASCRDGVGGSPDRSELQRTVGPLHRPRPDPMYRLAPPFQK
jgi:hypothetical protein